MAFAGIKSWDALAATIDAPSYSASNIRNMARGERDIFPHELYAIARACGLPAEWFDERINIAYAVRAEAQRIAAGGPPAPPGDLGHFSPDPGTTGEDREPSGSPGEATG